MKKMYLNDLDYGSVFDKGNIENYKDYLEVRNINCFLDSCLLNLFLELGEDKLIKKYYSNLRSDFNFDRLCELLNNIGNTKNFKSNKGEYLSWFNKLLIVNGYKPFSNVFDFKDTKRLLGDSIKSSGGNYNEENLDVLFILYCNIERSKIYLFRGDKEDTLLNTANDFKRELYYDFDLYELFKLRYKTYIDYSDDSVSCKFEEINKNIKDYFKKDINIAVSKLGLDKNNLDDKSLIDIVNYTLEFNYTKEENSYNFSLQVDNELEMFIKICCNVIGSKDLLDKSCRLREERITNNEFTSFMKRTECVLLLLIRLNELYSFSTYGDSSKTKSINELYIKAFDSINEIQNNFLRIYSVI